MSSVHCPLFRRLRLIIATQNCRRKDWADDEEFDDPNVLPSQQIINNPDGTKTVITYRFNDEGRKVKTARKIRTTIVKEHVNPRVAERKEWTKFGQEKGHPKGPDMTTTTVGENIMFKPSMNWKSSAKQEESPEDKAKREALLDKKVACRICKGDHFTARCPYKDTLPPMDDVGAGPSGDGDRAMTPEPQDGAGGSRYIAPHLRRGAAGKGDSLSGGKDFGGRERDDLATLRVTNVSEFADEQDIRDMFERFGRVTRVFLAKDRETGRAKGFAFVSYQERTDAARACEKMDGRKYPIIPLAAVSNCRTATLHESEN